MRTVHRQLPNLCLVLILVAAGAMGCGQHSRTNPYVQPGASNPWNSPLPSSTSAPPYTPLPPPLGQTTPTTPGLVAPPGATVPPGVAAPNLSIPVPTPIQRPNWNNPGTLQQQRQQANVFDPFANNEVGPEIVGGRPRDFQRPINEAVRAQAFGNPRTP